MTVRWTAAHDNATLTFTVPPDSFDFNSPEPASLALAGFGLGFVAWVSWCRRKIGWR